LNPHTFRYTILSRARLPIPPLRHFENERRGQSVYYTDCPTNSATPAHCSEIPNVSCSIVFLQLFATLITTQKIVFGVDSPQFTAFYN
jgi:hypothetical protein